MRVDRRVLAIVACLLWLIGVEALPGIHLATHTDDHSHASDGAIVHLGEHRHGDTVHVHGKPTKPRRSKTKQLAIDRVAHDATGLAHHAVAWTAPSPPLVAPGPIDSPAQLVEHACLPAPGRLAILHAFARGPPRDS